MSTATFENRTLTERELSRLGDRRSAEDKRAIDERITRRFEAIETIAPRPLVHYCAQCTQAKVEAKGKICPTCIKILAQKSKEQAEIKQAKNQLIEIALLVVVGVFVALFFSYCSGDGDNLRPRPATSRMRQI